MSLKQQTGSVYNERLKIFVLPCSGLISHFNHKVLVIDSIRVALFTGENEVGYESILEGFDRG